MPSNNGKPRRVERRTEAQERQARYDALTPLEKFDRAWKGSKEAQQLAAEEK